MEYVIQPQEEQQPYPRWLVMLVLFSFIALIIGYGLRALTPDAAPSQSISTSNFDETKSSFSNLIFTGVAPAIPEKLPTAQASEVQRINQKTELTLISKHKLEGLQGISGIWKGPEYNLTRTSNPETYVLTRKNLAESQILSKGIDVEKAISTGEAYIKEVFKDTNYVAFKERIVLYEIGTHPHPEAVELSKDANTIEVPFGYAYGPYPVFLQKDYSFPVTMIVNSDYQIQKLSFDPFLLNFIEGKTYKTLSIQQALGNIMRGTGSIVMSRYDGHGNPLLNEIIGGSFSGASIEYRVDEKTKTLLPYYRFTGELENNEKVVFYAEVITPAIQTEAP